MASSLRRAGWRSLLVAVSVSQSAFPVISGFSVSAVDVWNLGTERNQSSAQTLELSLLIFIKGHHCQVSEVDDLGFTSHLPGLPYSPQSSAVAHVARGDTRSRVVFHPVTPCFPTFSKISQSPFQTCLQ